VFLSGEKEWKKMQVKAILFDMDGLIIDTERVYRDGWRVGADVNGETLPESFLAQTSGKSVQQTTALLEEILHDREKIFRIRQAREVYFLQELQAGRIPLKPYFLEIIYYLKKQGYQTALVTSTAQERTRKIFDTYQLDPYFDVVVTGDLVQETKPNPAIYQLALAKLALSPNQGLVFEDSLTGARAAEAAEIPFILIPESPVGITEQQGDWQHALMEATDFQAALSWLRETKRIR
jgi:HAD superfamily hydrolase (TIGR01509 family)